MPSETPIATKETAAENLKTVLARISGRAARRGGEACARDQARRGLQEP